MEPLFRGRPWDQGKCNLNRDIPEWSLVDSGASAGARRVSSGTPYLKENGNVSMPEKFSSKLSCSSTAATKAILVKFSKMVI